MKQFYTKTIPTILTKAVADFLVNNRIGFFAECDFGVWNFIVHHEDRRALEIIVRQAEATNNEILHTNEYG